MAHQPTFWGTHATVTDVERVSYSYVSESEGVDQSPIAGGGQG